jgi:hypothetical protein
MAEGAAGEPPRPARLWTVEEANARTHQLRELLPQLKAWAVRLHKVHDELQRLSTFWGRELDAKDNPDRDLRARLDEEWRTLGRRLEKEISQLQEEGIEVKDLETGLVDFYSEQAGETVFLCWQRGETEVGYWHSLRGGYRTRRPLHRGFHPSSAARAHGGP